MLSNQSFPCGTRVLSVCLILADKGITFYNSLFDSVLAYFVDFSRKRPLFRAPRVVAYARVDCIYEAALSRSFCRF